MNIYSGRTSRACITPDCCNRVQAQNPNDVCHRCNKLARQRERDKATRAALRLLRIAPEGLRDAYPLWRETEPGALVASMGLIVWNELRMAA
jgi:hypothetical protein